MLFNLHCSFEDDDSYSYYEHKKFALFSFFFSDKNIFKYVSTHGYSGRSRRNIGSKCTFLLNWHLHSTCCPILLMRECLHKQVMYVLYTTFNILMWQLLLSAMSGQRQRPKLSHKKMRESHTFLSYFRKDLTVSRKIYILHILSVNVCILPILYCL